MSPVDYKKNQKIMDMFENESIEIQKIAITLGRLPKESEIGTDFPTYVNSKKGIVVESTNKISDDVVVASNIEPLGVKDGDIVFNEWLVQKEIWKQNYGVEAKEEQMEYQRIGTMKAVKITDEVLKELGSKDGLTAKIEVDFNDEKFMEVYKGGYLTDKGYGLAPEEFKKTYAIIQNNDYDNPSVDKKPKI